MIKLVESPEVKFDDIIRMGIIDRINYLISDDSGDNDIYTEYVIELFYDLMYKINEQKKSISSNIDKNEFKVIIISHTEIHKQDRRSCKEF